MCFIFVALHVNYFANYYSILCETKCVFFLPKLVIQDSDAKCETNGLCRNQENICYCYNGQVE